ncbi:MAG: hypothetical protein ACRC33_03145 [Gemmataceae bacterium]
MSKMLTRPRIEVLEGRAVPAGLIDVTFQNGALKILGDADANTLTVTQGADGRLTLTTDLGSSVRVNGQDVPVLGGHTLSTPVTAGVIVSLGGGNDALTFSGSVEDIDLPSFLSVNGGDGNNTLTLQQGVTVSGPLALTNGAGLDTTHLYDEVNVLGNLTVKNGNGGSLLDANAATDLRVKGALSVLSGAGFDEIDLSAAQKARLGAFVQKTGADLDGSDTDLSPVQSLTVTGVVSVANGAGDDDLDIGDATLDTRISGAVTVLNGAGSNHTDLVGTDRLHVGGPIVVTGGAGSDLVHLGINSGLVSFGTVTVSAGAGSNGTIVGGAELWMTGKLTYVGGGGADNFSVQTAADGMVGGAVKLLLGAGSNTLDVRAGNDATLVLGSLTAVNAGGAAGPDVVGLRDVKVLGVTAITTGAGNDQVTLEDVTFGGVFVLRTGAGNDVVNVEQDAALLGQTRFLKPVAILTGAGDDTVRLAGVLPAAGQKVLFGSKVTLDGGKAGTDVLQDALFVNGTFGPSPVKVGFEVM